MNLLNHGKTHRRSSVVELAMLTKNPSFYSGSPNSASVDKNRYYENGKFMVKDEIIDNRIRELYDFAAHHLCIRVSASKNTVS